MNHRFLTHQPATAVVGAALAALVLAGCGSQSHTSSTADGGMSTSSTPAPQASGSYGPPASGPHNARDVTFVKDMLPHHSQAVEMADMALTRDTTPEVKALAQQIKDAQAPEIRAMGGWLTGWGEQIPPTETMGRGSMDGHSMGNSMEGGTGMMDANQMSALDKASGTDFAKRWLTDMTEHHNGAVEMARTEMTSGQSADARKLAGSIIASQTAEIATMKRLLAGLA